jgi:hypothetical protein
MPVRTRSLFPLLAATLAIAGCPSVDQTGPATVSVATFDTTSGTIPIPNDLALQQAPGLPSGLQKELLLSFINAGGFPSDQETPIDIPVSQRQRNPDGSYGAPAPASVDLTTVTDSSVVLYRVDTTPAQRFQKCASPPTAPCWEAEASPGLLVLRRNGPDGNRRWDSGPNGAHYVVATANTIKTTGGVAIEADAPIQLTAASTQNIAQNPEALPSNLPPAQVQQLGQLQGVFANGVTWSKVSSPQGCAQGGIPVAPCWLPVPNGNAPSAIASVTPPQPGGIPQAQIASLTTFTIQPTTGARALTDTGSGQLPLPSDFLLDPATGKVRNVPAFGAAAAGLATLDGFSTTAPFLIPLSAPVNAATITTSSVLLFDVTTGTPAPVPLLSTANLAAFDGSQRALLQPPTAVSNGQSSAIVLAPAVTLDPQAPIFIRPLDEKHRYLVIVTNGVQDALGQALRRSTLMDLVYTFQSDLCVPKEQAAQGTCKSQVPGVSDADAAGLQLQRTQLLPVLTGLHLNDCSGTNTCAALVYTVKTQTVTDASVQLAAAPFAVEQGASRAVFAPSGTADFDTNVFGIPAAAFPNVTRFVQTNVPFVDALDHTTGALDPNFAASPKIAPLPVLVAVPKCAAPPCIAPLAVFHHGLNGSRYQMLTVADKLASKGFVVAAMDMVYHGERAYCTSNAQCSVDGSPTGADGVCTPNPALTPPIDANTVPGTCTTGRLRFNTTLSTVASGQFFISSNFFRVRDGIRQDQLDQAVLPLALARPPAASGLPQPPANDFAAALQVNGVVVDPTKVYYGGISLGGIVGTSVTATNPRFVRAAFSVPGGTIVDIFTTAPAFQSSLPPIFASLGIDLACVLQGTGCDPVTRAAQTAKFQQTLAVAKWILDPAEPVNYAANVVTKLQAPAGSPARTLFDALVAGGLASNTTVAYGQMVVGDQVVPNPTNRLLLNLTKSAGGASFDFSTYTSGGLVPEAARHALLNTNFLPPTDPRQQAGEILREDFGQFLLTGAFPANLNPAIP